MYEGDLNEPQNDDLFMREFKFYKKIPRLEQIDLETTTQLIDLQNLPTSNLEKFKLKLVALKTPNDERLAEVCRQNYGLKDVSEWKCFELVDSPGLFLIPNPFLNGYQRFFVKQCLLNYHLQPNKTNLDLHVKRDGQNLWLNAIEKNDFTEFNKLRWTTLGYHYDWTKKIYNEDDFTPMPEDVENLTKLIASAIGFDDYKPEAGIVNYYHLNSTLSAHQDYSEKNMNAPLVSISMGSAAVFLIGAQTKSIKPSAIVLRSGDVVIMSGPSRLAFHAVPKIYADSNVEQYFKYELNQLNQNSDFFVDDQEWSKFFDYIKINRINLNIRQVN